MGFIIIFHHHLGDFLFGTFSKHHGQANLSLDLGNLRLPLFPKDTAGQKFRDEKTTHTYFPRHPPSYCHDWGVRSPPKRIVFRFHETILSFGEPGSLEFPFFHEGFGHLRSHFSPIFHEGFGKNAPSGKDHPKLSVYTIPPKKKSYPMPRTLGPLIRLK